MKTCWIVAKHVWRNCLRYVMAYAILRGIVWLAVLYSAGMLIITLYLAAPLIIFCGGLTYLLVRDRITAQAARVSQWWAAREQARGARA